MTDDALHNNLAELEERLAALERRIAALEQLPDMVGRLKVEIEEMQEA